MVTDNLELFLEQYQTAYLSTALVFKQSLVKVVRK